MGNGEAKEFTCMTHGRELRGVGGIPEEMRILVGGIMGENLNIKNEISKQL